MKQFVRIDNAKGDPVLALETPAHPTMTLVISSPMMEKGKTYTIMTSDAEDGTYTKVADIIAE